MLQTQTIEPSTLELLKQLQKLPELSNTFLVGGTALALHFGHRLSIDIDLFGVIDHDDISLVLRDLGRNSFHIDRNLKNIKHFRINGVKVDIVNYSFPWIDSPILTNDIRVAGLKDIAAMKLNAITGRGSKKDFIDLYYLLRMYSLSQMLDFYSDKYPESSIFMVLKSLSYFEDAELEAMPRMLEKNNWNAVKQKITAELQRL